MDPEACLHQDVVLLRPAFPSLVQYWLELMVVEFPMFGKGYCTLKCGLLLVTLLGECHSVLFLVRTYHFSQDLLYVLDYCFGL